MKLYISADIEGVTGVSCWRETEKGNEEYSKCCNQMTKEVVSACKGAYDAGFEEIIIKDAHDTARNLDIDQLPEYTKLIKGWSGHPFCMVDKLDDSYDAAIFIGYHSAGGTNTSPLAHSMDPYHVQYIKINDILASEYLINAYTASYVNVPVVLVSGDKGLCQEVNKINPECTVVSVKEGNGSSVINNNPKKMVDLIYSQVYKTLNSDFKKSFLRLPNKFKVEIGYKEHERAYRALFYPGVRQLDAHSVLFESDDYMKVLTLIMYLT